MAISYDIPLYNYPCGSIDVLFVIGACLLISGGYGEMVDKKSKLDL